MEYYHNQSHTNITVYVNNSNLHEYEYYLSFDEVPLEVSTIVIFVMRMGITGSIAVFGIVTNTVNIVIFYRQGILSDSCTVSLTGLAVTDFVYCLLTVWNSICTFLLSKLVVPYSRLRFDVFGVWVMTAYRPQIILTHIVCYITTYLSFERFFTVIFPFKAKFVLTAKRSLVTVSVIIITTILLNFTQYADTIPVMVFDRSVNDTILIYVLTGLVKEEDYAYFHIYPSVIGLRAMSIVALLVFNGTIHWKVKLSARFRKSVVVSALTKSTSGQSTRDTICAEDETKTQNANSENGETKEAANASCSQKEVKLQRMIIVISAFFLVCYIPDSISNTFLTFNDAGHRGAFWRYVELMILCCTQLLQTINSSCNLIIYYTMSSRYRQELILCLANQRN